MNSTETATPDSAATEAATTSASSRPSKAAAGGPGAQLRRAWLRLSDLPGGKWVFSRMVDWMAPYTGSIRASVEELSGGYCRVSLRERRKLRNPFRSVHAVALMNLAEEASGLATLYALPDGVRGIITGLAMQYHKKARGKITATCETLPPDEIGDDSIPHVAEVTLRDEAGEVVAEAQATWTLARVR